MKLRRYYGIVLGFAQWQAHISFQIAYHENGKCVNTRYWGMQIRPSWPPVALLRGNEEAKHEN
jgi:hypothetical protein